MKNSKIVVFLPLYLFAFVSLCLLQNTIHAVWPVSVYWENDFFAKTDRHYTNGCKFSFITPRLEDYTKDENVPRYTKFINEWMTNNWLTRGAFSRDAIKDRNIILSFGQNMYTPNDKGASYLIVDDRPFAGWLYAGIGHRSRSPNRLDSLEFSIGMVGPASFAQEAQDWVHDLGGYGKFNGWDHQLKNEPGFILTYEQKRKISSDNYYEGFGADVIFHGGFTLGNIYTYANAGMEVRTGWKIPSDFGTSVIRPGGDCTPYKASDGFGLHVFAAGEGRSVGRNIFLDGNSFRDSHSVDKKHLVADASIGFGLTYNQFKLTYGQVYRTKEFKGQDDEHTFGSLTFSYSH